MEIHSSAASFCDRTKERDLFRMSLEFVPSDVLLTVSDTTGNLILTFAGDNANGTGSYNGPANCSLTFNANDWRATEALARALFAAATEGRSRTGLMPEDLEPEQWKSADMGRYVTPDVEPDTPGIAQQIAELTTDLARLTQSHKDSDKLLFSIAAVTKKLTEINTNVEESLAFLAMGADIFDRTVAALARLTLEPENSERDLPELAEAYKALQDLRTASIAEAAEMVSEIRQVMLDAALSQLDPENREN